MDPATLRQLREQSGLRLDKEGRFWHRGGLVEHARTLAALHQGIHRAAMRRSPGERRAAAKEAVRTKGPARRRAAGRKAARTRARSR